MNFDATFSWLACSADCAEPPGLLFRLSFDNQTLTADFAAGERRPLPQTAVKDFRFTEGVRGKGLVLQPGPQYTMLVYLYPIGDEAVFNHIHVGAGTPSEATWRAGAPVDLFHRGQWTHLASTWDARSVRLYANGRRVGEGLVASPLPKREAGTIYICPIDFWKNKEWADPAEQTVCDEVRIFGRALADDEILDLYAADAPIVRSGSRWPLARPLTSWPPPAPSSPSVSTCRPRARRCRPR